MKTFWLSGVLTTALAGVALGQTGTFPIISGPGAGRQVIANSGVVTASIPPGATTGNIIAPHAGAPGPHFHYHGFLLGNPDPDPGGEGWGFVNFALPATTTGFLPTTASGTIALTQGASNPFHLLSDQLPFPTATGNTETILKELQGLVTEHDAANAASHTPQTTASLRAAANWHSIQLIGPNSKP